MTILPTTFAWNGTPITWSRSNAILVNSMYAEMCPEFLNNANASAGQTGWSLWNHQTTGRSCEPVRKSGSKCIADDRLVDIDGILGIGQADWFVTEVVWRWVKRIKVASGDRRTEDNLKSIFKTAAIEKRSLVICAKIIVKAKQKPGWTVFDVFFYYDAYAAKCSTLL